MTTDATTRQHCAACGRDDLLLTKDGALRAHTGDRRRASETNPYCPGELADPGILRVRPTSSPEVLAKAIGALERGDVAISGDGSWQADRVPAPVPAGPQDAADALLMGTGPRPSDGGTDANDLLMSDAGEPPNDGMNCLIRNGRYALPDQITGAPRLWTRATTFAETISDLYAINLYKLQMATIGFANHPYLLDPFWGVTRETRGENKNALNRAHWRAAKLAGDKVPAEWGTRMHLWIERLSRDEITLADVEKDYRDEVTAWAAAMSEAGLSTVPDLIERRVAVPMYGVAGTLDQVVQIHRSVSVRIGPKIYRLHAGDYMIGDIKSGRDLSYAEGEISWNAPTVSRGEISKQLAIYAAGVRQGLVARWDPDAPPVREDDGGAWVWEKISIPAKALRTDVGVVMHVPVQRGEDEPARCTLNWINIERGWTGLQLCEAVREDRNEKGLMSPFSVAEVPVKAPAPMVREATWAERFGAVTSKNAAADLYREYRASEDFDPVIAKKLVAVAKGIISAITEESA